MFVRDHLAVVSHWARDQLRQGAEPEVCEQLRQLIEAADALRAEVGPNPQRPENVVALEAYRRHVR